MGFAVPSTMNHGFSVIRAPHGCFLHRNGYKRTPTVAQVADSEGSEPKFERFQGFVTSFHGQHHQASHSETFQAQQIQSSLSNASQERETTIHGDKQHRSHGMGFMPHQITCFSPKRTENICSVDSIVHEDDQMHNFNFQFLSHGNTQFSQNKTGTAKANFVSCHNAHAGGVASGMPLSLKMLKRKQKKANVSTSGLEQLGSSLQSAFSSMVFMMKTLQTHTLHIREMFFEQEIGSILNQVQREMHASFLWLFQQVFSCTPELMVLVMILLADFAVFSMANNLPLSPPLVISALADGMDTAGPSVKTSNGHVYEQLNPIMNSPSLMDDMDQIQNDSGWGGNGGRNNYAIAGGADGDPDSLEPLLTISKAVYDMGVNLPFDLSPMSAASLAFEEFANTGQSSNNIHTDSSKDQSMSDSAPKSATADGYNYMALDHSSGINETGHSGNSLNDCWFDGDIIQKFIAPLNSSLEVDGYPCYDKTDLTYQNAIYGDSSNSMVLANYAQFLFLVRKDHDRAEEFFRRAIMSDPDDSDAISRFANFMWLGRHNVTAAEKAFQEAVNIDPNNSFHAADYAYFLWNSDQ